MEQDEQLVGHLQIDPGEGHILPHHWPSTCHIEDGPAEAVWAHVVLHGKQESRAVWRGQGPTQPRRERPRMGPH